MWQDTNNSWVYMKSFPPDLECPLGHWQKLFKWFKPLENDA